MYAHCDGRTLWLPSQLQNVVDIIAIGEIYKGANNLPPQLCPNKELNPRVQDLSLDR